MANFPKMSKRLIGSYVLDWIVMMSVLSLDTTIPLTTY